MYELYCFETVRYVNLKMEQALPAVQRDIIRSKQDGFIRVQFPYHAKRIAQVKEIEGARWSPGFKGWLFAPEVDKLRQITKRLSTCTGCDTGMPLTCSRVEQICGISKNCSATAAAELPKSTPT